MESGEQRILIVEDDARLGAELEELLREEGFEVTWLQSGTRAALERVQEYHLVILDLMLPGRHGFDLLKQYREESDVPVIILTARKDSHDKLRGFKLGGDDYLTKPFWPEELVARVHARMRRPVIVRDEGLSFGPMRIDVGAREIYLGEELVEFTKVEFDLIAQLAQRDGKAMTRRQLVDAVLDEEREGTERTLDVHISRIRKKLGDLSGVIETVWGIGYKFSGEAAQPREED